MLLVKNSDDTKKPLKKRRTKSVFKEIYETMSNPFSIF